MTLLRKAESLARAAHAGQRDLTGPYTEHLERVVALVTSDDEKTVAWLHDIIEDTTVTASALLVAGFPDDIVDAVRILTRPVPGDYMDYIRTVKSDGNALAKAVKLADLHDHLRPQDPPVVKPERRRIYEKALKVMLR